MNKLSCKRKILLSLFGIFFLFCFGFFSFLMANRDDVRIIPINFSIFPDKPLMDVFIGSQKVSLLVDLGACNTFGLHASVMDSIPNKEFVKSSFLMDPKGDIYKTQEFIIPSLRIQSHTYEKMLVYEEGPEQIAEGGFLSGLAKRVGPIRGKVGRPFFTEWTCLFDCPNERLLLAPTIDSLLKYADLQKFTQIPFELRPHGIILSLSTDLGTKEFLLDTGATASFIRPTLVSEDIAEEVEAPLKRYTTSTLSYNGQEFGPIGLNLNMHKVLTKSDLI